MTTYKHKHHIVPRHMGGTDDPSNIIELTIEEHAEAHRKLWEEHGCIEDKLAWKGLLGLISKQDILLELHKNRPRSSYASYGMLGKTQSKKWQDSIKKSNNCPVSCEGVIYASVGEAQAAYPGCSIRKKLDNPKYAAFYRLREKTLRK
jgi:hypothetical protein